LAKTNGTLSMVRVAAGSVAPIPQRFPAVEEALLGSAGLPGDLIRAGEILAAEMIRITGVRWSTPYKEPVVGALARRALRSALVRA
jgi:CO/xanthine dehydrogenase FAD-binding subunit